MKRYRYLSLAVATTVLTVASIGQAATPSDLRFQSHMAHVDLAQDVRLLPTMLPDPADDLSLDSVQADDDLRHKLIYVQSSHRSH